MTAMGKPSQDPEPAEESTAILLALGNSYLGQAHFCPPSDEALGRGAAQGPLVPQRWESPGLELLCGRGPAVAKGKCSRHLRF